MHNACNSRILSLQTEQNYGILAPAAPSSSIVYAYLHTKNELSSSVGVLEDVSRTVWHVLSIGFDLGVSVMSAAVQLTLDRSTPNHGWKR